MKHIEIKNSLDSKLQTYSICSVRILDIFEVIAKTRFSKMPKCSTLVKVLDRFETEFVKVRMAALEQFLMRVSSDTILSQATCYKNFLTMKQYDFNAIKVNQ